MKRLRVYIDTSVVGGCRDEEFAAQSRSLFEMARRRDIELIVSALLLTELENAPSDVQSEFRETVGDELSPVPISPEAERLRDAYLGNSVLGRSSANDALHVALATVAGADVVVSWNFRHIVHLDKIRGFNAVNIMHGYGPIEIRSPKELV